VGVLYSCSSFRPLSACGAKRLQRKRI
jgi:hypothetical protein